MVYAMAPRGDWGMWKFWEEFGITNSKMIGYWDDHAPVTTDIEKVKATAYVKDKKTLIVLGSWLSEPVNVHLEIDWEALGLRKGEVEIEIPKVDNYQEKGFQRIDDAVPIDAKGVKFLIITEK